MKYTLLTGACGGLGSAFAELLASRGEPLVITGTDAEKLQKKREELLAVRPALPVEAIVCDLRSEEARRALFSACDEKRIRFGRLVYVAGVDTQMGFEKYDEARIITQTRVNLEGAVSLVRGVLGRGDLDGTMEILAVGSMSGAVPMPYFALYSATKRGLEQFFSALHEELNGRVKVTCVLPGSIPTREDIRENIKTHGLFGKLSQKEPSEVARISLAAVRKNRRRKVIGFWNRMLLIAMSAVPMSAKLRFIRKKWSKTEKDFYAEK